MAKKKKKNVIFLRLIFSFIIFFFFVDNVKLFPLRGMRNGFVRREFETGVRQTTSVVSFRLFSVRDAIQIPPRVPVRSYLICSGVDYFF